MISLTKNSKLKPEEVFKKAKAFFAGGGFGLEIKEEDSDHLYMEGGGGAVNVIVSAITKGAKVDIEAKEWEIQAKNFMASIK